MTSTVCLHGLQKKTPLRLGIAQITPPAARSFGNFFTFVYAPKIKSVEINLCRDVPPCRLFGQFFHFRKCQNQFRQWVFPQIDLAQRKGRFLRFLPLHPPQSNAKHFRNFPTSMKWLHRYAYTRFIFSVRA